ncbi:sensor histidine kinase [Flavobacterium olei]|uniref:sensor histidine kinase n=1 Tax=Flavobacterium olei TaxID=1886782 RepID=UPI0032190A46
MKDLPDARGIHYQVDITEKEPFYSDSLRLNTVLENLISNAIKYHRKEEPGRFIKITGYSDNKGFEFSIADNGMGIAPQYHQRIYEMFFRLSVKKSGSGIGLYIVKDALELLEGSIEIQSEEGIGTTFTITLKNLKL